MGCAAQKQKSPQTTQSNNIHPKPIPENNKLVCPIHSQNSVRICTNHQCTKQSLICSQCLVGNENHEQCTSVETKEIDKQIKKWKDSKDANIQQVEKHINDFYDQLISKFEHQIRDSKSRLLFDLQLKQVDKKFKEQDKKILYSYFSGDFYNQQSIDKKHLNMMRDIISKQRKKLDPAECLTINSQIATSIQHINQQIDEICQRFQASQNLSVLLGLKKKIDSKDTYTIKDFKSQIFVGLADVFKQNFISIYNQSSLKNLKNFRLRYRASTSQYSSERFHIELHDVQNTLVLIRTTKDVIFGAYTPQPWKLQEEAKYIADKSETSFIFSVTQNKKFALKPNQQQFAIRNDQDCGPIFGKGHDIHICDKCDKQFSYCNLGKSYQSSFMYNTQEAQTELANQKRFKIKEYQVWSLI